MTSAIEFQDVSKRFVLHRENRNAFHERIAKLFRKQHRGEEFWALRNVSFNIARGESFGLVGHNGAGKSTALKLMTRLLEPTSGSVRMTGRVAALLELGSGFHPDLNGRENVFLYGSLMGLSRRDMQARLDEIIDFSEIGDFIDLEIKHYSSGMYTRLAFAVATAVDPDILITDEILAVGDEGFQRKCLERIVNFRRQGKTIIFVSHGLEVVRSLCDQAIWLDHGQPRALGNASEVIDAYLADTNKREAEARRRKGAITEPEAEEKSWRHGSYEAEITAVELLDRDGRPQELFYTGEPLTIRLHYHAHQRLLEPQFGLAIYHANGAHITGPNNTFAGFIIDAIEGDGWVDYTIPDLPLLSGLYRLSVAIHDATGLIAYDFHTQHYSFTVRSHTIYSYGMVKIPARWEHHR